MSGFTIEESFLETPTSILAIVFLILQAMCIIFQFIVNSLKRLFRSKNRLGMVTALDHSVWELTLVGFISLCLIALQTQITSICVSASPARSSWSIIHHMYSTNSCPCCLQNTRYTQQCILEHSGCGNSLDPYCNCNNQNATCVQPYVEQTVEITDAFTGGNTSAILANEAAAAAVGGGAPTEGLRRLLGGGGGGGAAAASGSASITLEKYCLEDVTVPASTCPPGQMPVVSFLALEQVHLLIFTIAVVHVFMGFLLYLAASARLWFQWSRWSHKDDLHTILVREKLEEYYASLNDNHTATTSTATAAATAGDKNKINSTITSTSTTIDADNGNQNNGTGVNGGQQQEGDGGATTAAGYLPPSPFDAPQSTNGRSKLTQSKSSRRIGSSKFASVAAAVLEAAGIDLEAGRQDPYFANTKNNATSFNQRTTPAVAVGGGAAAGAEGGGTSRAPPLALPSMGDMKKHKSRFSMPSLKKGGSSVAMQTLGSTPLPDVLTSEGSYGLENSNCCGGLSFCGGNADGGGGSQDVFIKIWEYLTCFVFGLSPFGVVNHETYSIMRASYIYTHKLSTQFAFLDHVQRNLEDDLSHIVGLSAEFWIIIVLFILSSGPFGYAVTPFMGAVALILCITNAKLVDITRKVTRRGGVGRLTSSIFWFNRPQLLLIPIKLVLFFCAFVYASFIFFVWQFGDGSCPFQDGFYTGWVLPWYTIIIANTILFLHMAVVTLPTYSLCVLMGSDVKAHMLPRKFAKKLMAVASAAKEKVKAEKAAAAAAAAATDAGGNNATETNTVASPSTVAPSTAATNTNTAVDLVPAMSGQPSTAFIGIRESKFDRAVSLISKRLVGEHHD